MAESEIIVNPSRDNTSLIKTDGTTISLDNEEPIITLDNEEPTISLEKKEPIIMSFLKQTIALPRRPPFLLV